MIDRLLLEHTRLSAMKAVLDRDEGFLLRQIQRWYSSKFHTPLHHVVLLDEEFVLQAHFEDMFAGKDDEGRMEELADALETKEQARERMFREDAVPAEEILFSRIIDAKNAELAAKKAAEPAPLKKIEQPQKDRPLRTTMPEPSFDRLTLPKPLEEDCHIEFISESDLLAEMEAEGLMGGLPDNLGGESSTKK